MKKLAGLVAVTVLLLAGIPFAIAVVAVTTTAAAASDCGGDPGLRSLPTASAADPGAVGDGRWRAPFDEAYARTSPFGMRFDPVYRRHQLHAGQDLASLPSPGPVVAAADGTVVTAGPNGGYGNAVTIAHTGGVVTLYGHLAHIAAGIRPGARVAVGQELGIEGATGAATGPHLHFEIRVDGKPVDPVPFMAARSAPLDGRPFIGRPFTGVPSSAVVPSPATDQTITHELPPPGWPRHNSLTNPPLPIPPDILARYQAAAERYGLPWQLLAGIGMEETAHGRIRAVSGAGAQGLMQFMPATWALYGTDGDGDGRADITNDADSVWAAARYLVAEGALRGTDGVKQALFAYNHADWYVNDVLTYSAAYSASAGGPAVTGCLSGNPDR